ncbi:GntR family transcriptional regulator, carbon starvation induced regulator [Ketogulonicigenium robustum]|uniref:GntR family transcriptional regulator, carbon starvation induced regulator n=1 Tax=Ketogulonicigenium robustum TaxID=92947 RepID=A0A1W6NX79_9RHOB|nr:GntR family transcriptional regulator [Ketogulonicigenium robustum]ARO13845.1 GntR family transcriptional regulator, carbon starvation induced regulator [Ketogulonicigenium robustum]
MTSAEIDGEQQNGLTVSENAYRRMRSDIIFGRLRPKQKLKLDGLRDSYGISISTLREILNRLSSEGLVVAEGQRGFEVAPVSVENLKEVAALRLLLEAHALKQSFAAGGVEWEGDVVASHHKLATLERRMAAGDMSQTELWKRYDWEFHQSLISACGSQVLMDTHAAIFDKYLRYQMIALSFRGDIAASEHRVLLEAALDRDSKTAREVLARHVQGGLEHALAAGLIA